MALQLYRLGKVEIPAVLDIYFPQFMVAESMVCRAPELKRFIKTVPIEIVTSLLEIYIRGNTLTS